MPAPATWSAVPVSALHVVAMSHSRCRIVVFCEAKTLLACPALIESILLMCLLQLPGVLSRSVLYMLSRCRCRGAKCRVPNSDRIYSVEVPAPATWSAVPVSAAARAAAQTNVVLF